MACQAALLINGTKACHWSGFQVKLLSQLGNADVSQQVPCVQMRSECQMLTQHMQTLNSNTAELMLVSLKDKNFMLVVSAIDR